LTYVKRFESDDRLRTGFSERDLPQGVLWSASVLAKGSPAIVPVLIDGLHAPSNLQRWVSARALGHRDETHAIPALIALLRTVKPIDPNGAVSDYEGAEAALVEIGAPSVPALIPLLTDHSIQVRALASKTLGEIGPPARAALPPLKRLAADPSNIVRGLATEAALLIERDPHE